MRIARTRKSRRGSTSDSVIENKASYDEQWAFQRDLVGVGKTYFTIASALLTGILIKLNAIKNGEALHWSTGILLIGALCLFGSIGIVTVSFMRLGAFEFVADPSKGQARSTQYRTSAEVNYKANIGHVTILSIGSWLIIAGLVLSASGVLLGVFAN
jgi:hypothetical protein